MWAKFCDLYYETRYFICSCKRNDLKLKRNLKLKKYLEKYFYYFYLLLEKVFILEHSDKYMLVYVQGQPLMPSFAKCQHVWVPSEKSALACIQSSCHFVSYEIPEEALIHGPDDTAVSP